MDLRRVLNISLKSHIGVWYEKSEIQRSDREV
jgi:hypothetical protein